MTRIHQDQNRFRQIVRGKIRENLRRYISHDEMLGRQGKDLVSIPVPQLDVPHFRHGKNSGGVGQGEGQPGQSLGPQGNGSGAAGDTPAEHLLEVEISLEELADILGEELALPRIEPKGQANLHEERHRYNAIRKVGPESLRHFKRTYMQAIRRQISSNQYTFDEPKVTPIRDDTRYRSWSTTNEPVACAAIVYMMDVSGSMTDDQKAIVRTEAFWIDTWLKRNYRGVERRYIVHDAAARVVDENTFYRTRESGGTRISSAYETAAKLIEAEFPIDDWNLYAFHFSDGDNWGEDNQRSVNMLREKLLPVLNLFGYAQVESPYGSGEFAQSLRKAFQPLPENLILSELAGRDDIVESIKQLLGAGK